MGGFSYRFDSNSDRKLDGVFLLVALEIELIGKKLQIL